MQHMQPHSLANFFEAKVIRFGQIWLDLSKFEQIWLKFGQIWLDLGKSG